MEEGLSILLEGCGLLTKIAYSIGHLFYVSGNVWVANKIVGLRGPLRWFRVTIAGQFF